MTPPQNTSPVTSAEVSVKQVLNFVRTAYQVNTAVEGSSVKVDWNAVSSNSLLAKLKEHENTRRDIFKAPIEEENCKIRRSSSLDVSKKGLLDVQQPFIDHLDQHDRTVCDKKVDLRRPGNRRRSSLSMKKDIVADNVSRAPERYIKRKLNEVLQEGILDSVLPYILTRQPQSMKKSSIVPPTNCVLAADNRNPIEINKCNTEKLDNNLLGTKKEIRRKSTSSIEGNTDKKDVEVVIHVCDEVKNTKKDFRCPQSLLVSRMRYFAQVTAGQSLDEMDISVHCDVSIFDWLIRWVKQEGNPTLNTSIVIPVLMSSAFLQMDSLQDACLNFCRSHINEVIRDSSNLSCINDSVVTRLANMFTNTEIEALKDRKDKLTSKLYCKFIMFLTESTPQARRGHYASIAYLFRCSKCGKLLSEKMSTHTSCVSKLMTMNENGEMISKHVRDPAWSLTELVRQLKTQLVSWRRVYWRLWGISTQLKCSFCGSVFSLCQIAWCSQHSEAPQFFSMEHQRTISFPVGRYPCCGEKAFRFELFPVQTGCLQRDHTPELHTDTAKAIMKIYKQHRELIRIADEESEAVTAPRLMSAKNQQHSLWWDGLQLTPFKPKLGLLGGWLDGVVKPHDNRLNTESKPTRLVLPSIAPSVAAESESSSSNSSQEGSESPDSGEDSGAESYNAAVRVTAKPRHIANSHINAPPSRKESSQVWLAKLSTRCNQDNQRELEEKALRHIQQVLARKTATDTIGATNLTHNNQNPPGGTYVRVEAEWRDLHCSSHGCPANSKLRLSSSTYKSKSKR